MKLLPKIAKLIHETYQPRKYGFIYIGKEDYDDLDKLETAFEFNNPEPKRQMEKLIRGAKVKKPKIMGLDYARSCLNKTKVEWF